MPPEPDKSPTLSRRALAWLGHQPPIVLACASFFAITAALALCGIVFTGTWSEHLRSMLNARLASIALLAVATLGLLLTRLVQLVARPDRGSLTLTCLDARESGSVELHRRAAEWIRSARREVHVLEADPPVDRSVNGPPDSAAAWYEALFELPNRGVRYTHLLQSSNAAGPAEPAPDSLLHSHIQIALVRRAAGSNAAFTYLRLLTAPPSIPETLVLIDDRRLIWHLHEKTGEGAEVLSGMMFVEDPSGSFVSAIRRRFDRIEARASAVTSSPGRAAPRAPDTDGRRVAGETVVLDWRRPG